jgi:Fic family protein
MRNIIDPTPDQIIDYVWHSNRIDSNTVDPKKLTRAMVEDAYNNRINGTGELVQHVQALFSVCHVVDESTATPTKLVRMFHSILMKDLIDEPGNFRTYGVWVGGYGTVNHKDIPKYMKRLDGMLVDARTEQDAWEIHDEFECIHPFIHSGMETAARVDCS